MLIIAHRGASFEAPENTLSAIQKSLDLGADLIEIDVRLCKGNIPVVIHDSVLYRTTNLRKAAIVEELTLDELQRLDAGSWFGKDFVHERIPTLAEVLALDFGKTGLMIEIKEGAYSADQIAGQVVSVVSEHPCVRAIGSFSEDIVDELLKTDHSWDVIGIVENLQSLEKFRVRKLKRYGIWYPLLNPTIIQTLHEEGAQIWTFTVDDLAKIRFLESIHVDGVITNNPRQLLV